MGMVRKKATLGRQPLINIGTAGHVDHGKTTLIEALTGTWAARHSEELKRGITLKLGYADTGIYKCPNCQLPEAYYTENTAPPDMKCRRCEGTLKFLRHVSFVDVPGHEMLMAVMLSGATLMDSTVFVIDASQKCPQPQTREHFMALSIIGVENIIVVQNKIDIVEEKNAEENYRQIKDFLSGTKVEDAPIIPVSALHGSNLDVLIWAMEELMPDPERDPIKPARMFVARSFDVNLPGTSIEDLTGGVLGGSISQGSFEVGDEIEIKPGVKVKEKDKVRYDPLFTTITSLRSGESGLKKAYPGGLIGVGTTMDSSLTKADALMGNVAGEPETLPPSRREAYLEVHLMERVVGAREMGKVEPIRRGESLLVNAGTTVTLGKIVEGGKDSTHMVLSVPVVAEDGYRLAISRQIAGRWRLIGYGFIK